MAQTPLITRIETNTGRSANDGITNDQSLILRGLTEADSTVTVNEVSLGVLGTATANQSSVWQLDITGTILLDSDYQVSTSALDLAGNESPDSKIFNAVVDTVAPSAPTGLDLIASSDRGESETDNIIRINTLTFVGDAEFDRRCSCGNGHAQRLGECGHARLLPFAHVVDLNRHR